MKKLLLLSVLLVSTVFALDINDDLTITENPAMSGLVDVSITSISNGEVLSYNSSTGKWENGSLSYTETDPIVGAITGLVKADGAGNISAAVAGTDYLSSISGLAPDTATTQAAQPNITSLGTITALVTTDATVNESIGFDAINTITYNGTTTTADWGTGNVASMTFGAGNIGTFAFTDPSTVGQTVKVKLIQDGTGSRTVTAWDSDIQWANGGDAPTLTTDASGEDWVTCIFTNTGAGNRYDCSASLDFQ